MCVCVFFVFVSNNKFCAARPSRRSHAALAHFDARRATYGRCAVLVLPMCATCDVNARFYTVFSSVSFFVVDIEKKKN